MKTHASFHPLTLASAFEQFLEISSFARRTRESYAEDLAPLLAEAGQQPVRALTTGILHAFLARLNPLRQPLTIGVWLHCGVSPAGSAIRDGWQRCSWMV